MATVSSQLTRIHDVEGAVTILDISGGPGGTTNEEIKVQGSQCIARRQSNVTNHGTGISASATGFNVASKHIGVWIFHLAFSVVVGLKVRFGSSDSSLTTNFVDHQFNLANYPKTGGWVRMWINEARVPEASGGTFDNTSLKSYGVKIDSIPSVAGTSQNIAVDSAEFTAGSALLLTGTTGVWQDFIDFDFNTDANRFGVVIPRNNVIFIFARVTLGSSSSLVFNDSNFIIIFPDQATVASTFMGISVDLQNASTDIDWKDGVIKSAGTVKGDLIVTGTSGAFDVNTCTLSNLRVIDLTSAATVIGSTISDCGLITANSGAIKSSLIIGTTDPVKALIWNTAVDTDGKLDDTEFQFKTAGHAIELGSNTPSTITLSGVKFTGYDGDGTTNSAIFNNSGTAITINITNGGDTPSVRNGVGASTTVQSSQTHKLTGLTVSTEVTYVRTDTGSTVFNVEDVDATGSTAFTYGSGLVGVNVDILIHHVTKVPILINTNLPSGNAEIPITQRDDRIYENP